MVPVKAALKEKGPGFASLTSTASVVIINALIGRGVAQVFCRVGLGTPYGKALTR